MQVSPFSEFRTGPDHLELRVSDQAELDAWAHHLDTLGVVRSPIVERPSAAILTFRDPDNIQLELYALDPDADATPTAMTASMGTSNVSPKSARDRDIPELKSCLASGENGPSGESEAPRH